MGKSAIGSRLITPVLCLECMSNRDKVIDRFNTSNCSERGGAQTGESDRDSQASLFRAHSTAAEKRDPA